MNSATIRPGIHAKAGQAAAAAPSSQAILLDKLNARQSTPDSEALASSDEELEHRHQAAMASMAQQQKQARRPSLFNDAPQAPGNMARKGSFASTSMSPTQSHPPTPSAEPGTWGPISASSAGLGRGPTGTSSFPWGGPIWNTDRKDASIDNATSQLSLGQRDQSATSQIPFPIPLHPTPKTYRSQSYSVGQMEADAMGSSALMGSRARNAPYSGLQHRSSRPSMLSEVNDGSGLGKVNEDDDDDSAGPLQGSQHQTDEKTQLEMLQRENAYLKQQAAQQYQQNPRIRPRASSGLNGYFQESVPEESDYAVEVDDNNDPSDVRTMRSLSRRMSEFGVGAYRSPFTSTFENRKLENVKKGMWQTSLGFGGPGDLAGSRRHSFADVPMPVRQNSIVSVADSVGTRDNVGVDGQDPYLNSVNEQSFSPSSAVPNNYFTGGSSLAQHQPSLGQTGYAHMGYASHPTLYANRSGSPPRGMYGPAPPRQNTPLHIVCFKCCRADVFYIQEDSGFKVKAGDLVIVEADRGQDLGTVAEANCDWQKAKKLKEYFAEEHYKWLMMYSQTANAQGGEDGTGAGLMAASSGMAASAIGGMGPPSSHHVQEQNPGELKPKLIKRQAHPHEIATLREKEGMEAKAKRVCMQKVKDHGLNMEILDAEFQVDWKKLIFYYFAESYINFNSLVTDLFKLYKTRIWMSAINPASFANPTLGLQPPSGIGPGAVGASRGGTQERHQNPTAAAAERVVRPSNSHSSFNEQQSAMAPAAPQYGMAPAAAASYQPFGGYGAYVSVPRPGGGMPYGPAMMQMDQFRPAYTQSPDYQMGRAGYSHSPVGNGLHDAALQNLNAQADWTADALRGLSLNGR